MAFAVVVVFVAVPITVVMVVIMVVVLMIMAVALLSIVVMVVSVLMVMVVIMIVVVIMVVTVTFHMLVQLVVEAGVVYGMVHPVPELVFVDIEDGAHECEVDPLLGVECSMVLDTVVQVGQVECDTGAVIKCDGCLDVAEKTSGFLLHPLPDGQEGLCEPGLGVGVVAVDLSGEPDCASSRLLDGGLLVVVMLVLMIVVMLAHCIIS